MVDIRKHAQTLAAKDAILAAVKRDERGRVRLSEAVLKQLEGRIIVENYDSIDVTGLIRSLPNRSRVFSRAPHKGGGSQVVLSRLDVYYPIDDYVWRMRKIILLLVWVIMPTVGALVFLFSPLRT
jgi:hypothetical protein